MGINSTNFDDPTNYPGWIGGHSYLFSDAPGMIIGSTSGSSQINMFVGGVNPIENSKLVIRANNQHSMTGSLSISGSLANGEGVIASSTFSHAEGSLTKTGIENAYYAISAEAGLITLSSSYGDVTANFGAGNILILDDRDYGGGYYPTYAFIIGSVVYNAPSTQIQLLNTTVSTRDSITDLPIPCVVGDLTLGIDSWTGDKRINSISSHAEGIGSRGIGLYSHAEGNYTQAAGQASHAEGNYTKALGYGSHAEGLDTITFNNGSHAEGRESITYAPYSHVEGEGTITDVLAYASHAEGDRTITSGSYSHAEGILTIARGRGSHAEGSGSIAIGRASHAEGYFTVASGAFQHVQGQYNISSSAQGAFIIGNGTSNTARRNLVFASGSIFQITGSLQVSGSITGSLFGTSSWANNAVTSSYILNAVSSSFASTASSADNFTVRGTLTAQTIVAQTITSSTDFVTGSTRFGSSLSNTHQFTGSISITGSLTLPYLSTGSILFAGATDDIAEDNTNFFWDNTNKRLGVGTNAPTTLLNVRGNYAGALDNSIPQLLFENANNTTSANLSAIIRARISTGYSGGFPEIWIDTTRDSSNNGFTRVRTVSNHPLSFWTNDTERVRLFSGGNLLIQTGGTFTDTGERLQVSGSSKFVGNMVITGSATITAGVGVSGTSAFTIGSGTNFTLNGAVGGQLAYSYAEYIGALYYAGFSGVTVGMRGSSAVLLGNTATSYPFAVVNDRVAIGHISPTALLHISGSTGGLFEIDSNTAPNTLYVSSSGNIGIGTNTPNASLHISGSTSGTEFSLLVQNSSGQTLISTQNDRTVNINNTNSVNGNTSIGTRDGTITFIRGFNNTLVGNALTFYAGGAASTIQGFNTDPGISIGYSQIATNPHPGTGLSIRGTTITSGSAVLFVTGSSTTRLLALASETNPNAFVVSGSGNVGIGTTAPTTLLHISGTTGGLLEIDSNTAANILYVSSSGNIGIGTNAPAYGLDVSTSVRFSNTIGISTGYAWSVQRLQFNNGTAGTNLGYLMAISNGVFRLSNAAETDFTRLQFGGTTTSFPALQRVSSSLSIVDATGASNTNLLVGTTADTSERLQVSGSSRFNGNMVITGSGATSGTNGLNIVNSNLVSTLIARNDGRISNGDNTFYVDRYNTGGTTMVLSVNGHNGATGIEVTNAVGIRAYSNLGVSVNNALGASIYAAGGNTNGPTNISLGLLSNRALITSTASGMAMHTSSMLQVDSTTQGFLPPRMTAAQRNAISTPARGLLVYDIDSTTEGLWLYNSGSTPGWQEVLTNSGSQSISGSLTATSFTGSLFGTSSWAQNAVTASYALNGGVTQIIAGTNVTISPAGGTGSVTINATGGGGASFPFTGSALITGSLVITGSTTSTLGFTGSLFGTASWAQNAVTASYALTAQTLLGSVVSASYAATASYATSFYVSGSLNVGNTNIEFQENTNVTSGSWRVISSEPTASYRAAFFDYVMFSGSIARAGTIYSVWSASYAEYYENYTGDVGGSTAGVTLQAAISGSNIQLQATASNNAWTIRSLVRML
jgi:hypothetical protein